MVKIVAKLSTKMTTSTQICKPSNTDFKSLQKAHQEYEKCVLEEALKEGNPQNITYHPIFENFPEHEDLFANPMNLTENQKSSFQWILTTAYTKCVRPCTDVIYQHTIEPFFDVSDTMRYFSGYWRFLFFICRVFPANLFYF